MMHQVRIGLDLGLLLLMLVTACNGPTLPLATPVMTVARHDSEVFPTAHGDSENSARDCNVCHGGFDSFAQYNCLGCHAHAEDATDDEHAGVVGYEYTSDGCYGCHPTGVTTGTGLDHFPVQTGSPHAEVKCAECHTTKADYKKYSCIDCHDHPRSQTDTHHAGVSGYAFASANCYRCHPDGKRYPAQHELFFPIATGSHAVFACNECHFEPTKLSVYTCTQCHLGSHACESEAARHAAVSGYTCSESACLTCHRSGSPGGG